jgi:hypothetical protein
MNTGTLNLFIKMVSSDYALDHEQANVLKNRMLADDREFERIWELYKSRARKTKKGVDQFASTLQELIS